MNLKFSFYLYLFQIMCCFLTTYSYIMTESEESYENLLNSYSKQIDSNVLNTENTPKSVKFIENRASVTNQTISSQPRQNQIPSKRVIQKLKSCAFCNKERNQLNSKEEEYNPRLEYIKQQILSRLGMSKPPKHLHKQIDSNYLQLLEASTLSLPSDPEPIQKSKDSDKVFIFWTTKRFNIPQFNISIALDSFGINSIKKISLLVKQRSTIHPNSQYDNNSVDNEVTVVSTAIPVNGVLTPFQDISNMRVLGIVNPQTNADNGMDRQSLTDWVQYDLTDILKPEVMKSNKLVSFDCESFDFKDSVIIVEKDNQNVWRTKRSIDCTGNTTSCCRENFYVNFTTIGWDNWILQPIGYNANYCRGKCDISNARYHHTTVIGKFQTISLCCSPREMSHISLIYLDDKGVVFQKNLANMKVESCDCA